MTTKQYHREQSAAHYKKYKKKYNQRCKEQRQAGRLYLETFKVGGCIKCDEKDPAALDFHHLHSKDKVVSSMAALSKERILKEVAKCVILCANCHRKHHAGKLEL